MSERMEPVLDLEIPPPGEAPKRGIEQRRHPRFDYVAPVFIRVLVEEETFNPLRFSGQSCNISRGGILLRVQGLSEEHYKLLIHRQRMVRVHAQIAEAGGEVVFFGKIVWYDFRCTDQGTSCLLGVAFEALPEKAAEVLDGMLAQLAAASGSSEPGGPKV